MTSKKLLGAYCLATVAVGITWVVLAQNGRYREIGCGRLPYDIPFDPPLHPTAQEYRQSAPDKIYVSNNRSRHLGARHSS